MTLAIDASSPAIKNGTGTGTLTTASFTPPAGAFLVAVSCGGYGASVTTSTISDSLSGTWTSRVTANATNGGANGIVQISTRVIGSSAAMTVSASYSNLSGGRLLGVYVMTGADTSGVGNTATLNVNVSGGQTGMTTSLTTTVTGSLVLGGADSSGTNGTVATAASNTSFATMTGTNPVSNGTDLVGYGIIKSTSATGTPGSHTYGVTWDQATNGHLGLVEIKPTSAQTLDADVSSTVTATRTTALGGTTKPIDATRAVTATLTTALAGSAKPVDVTNTVTAALTTALGGTTKPVNVSTQTVTATTTATVNTTQSASATSSVTATITAAAEQFPGIKTDFASGADAAVSTGITPAVGETGTAADTATTITPNFEDQDDEQVFGVEGVASIALTLAETGSGSGDEDQSITASLSSADTASGAEDQLVAPDQQINDADTFTGSETFAEPIQPVSGGDTASAVDAASVSAELSSDDSADSAAEDQDVLQLTTFDVDDFSGADDQLVVANVSSDDTGTAVEDGGAQYFLDDDDPATGDDAATAADSTLSTPDTGSAAEATSIASTGTSSADTAHGTELSPAFSFIANKYLVSSRQ